MTFSWAPSWRYPGIGSRSPPPSSLCVAVVRCYIGSCRHWKPLLPTRWYLWPAAGELSSLVASQHVPIPWLVCVTVEPLSLVGSPQWSVVRRVCSGTERMPLTRMLGRVSDIGRVGRYGSADDWNPRCRRFYADSEPWPRRDHWRRASRSASSSPCLPHWSP